MMVNDEPHVLAILPLEGGL